LAMVEHTAAMCGMAAATTGVDDGFGSQRQDEWLNGHTRTRLSCVYEQLERGRAGLANLAGAWR
jgi:hypothetical protein